MELSPLTPLGDLPQTERPAGDVSERFVYKVHA